MLADLKNGEAWWATVHGVTKRQVTERLILLIGVRV